MTDQPQGPEKRKLDPDSPEAAKKKAIVDHVARKAALQQTITDGDIQVVHIQLRRSGVPLDAMRFAEQSVISDGDPRDPIMDTDPTDAIIYPLPISDTDPTDPLH
jgi:hypothetical protein